MLEPMHVPFVEFVSVMLTLPSDETSASRCLEIAA
jgi:hypothetical protein